MLEISTSAIAINEKWCDAEKARRDANREMQVLLDATADDELDVQVGRIEYNSHFRRDLVVVVVKKGEMLV